MTRWRWRTLSHASWSIGSLTQKTTRGWRSATGFIGKKPLGTPISSGGGSRRIGATPSKAKSLMGTVFGAMQAPMTGMARDEIVKNFLVDHAAEQFEVASYRALVAAAREIGDEETALICEEILREDEAMAAWIMDNLPRIVQERMRELAAQPV